MMPERMQPVCIGGGDQWFPKAQRDFFRTPIRIKKSLVKMAELDCIEAIDFCVQARSD